ncbi:hypothetical protein AB0M29_04005 [Streptomyces sp. NPDC051976]|uniref:hypothetical protein n=1 Tax=Streptomyces sp. NPDC051976 TaxID=3154947 RepID=UPI00342DAB48
MAGFGARHGDAPAEPQDVRHRRALILSEIAAEGPVRLFRALREAASGDDDAAGIRVSALVRALPGRGAINCHELLLRAHIKETGLAGDLTADQRVALVGVLDRAQYVREHRSPSAA